jgi:hypothetical protein
MPGADQQLDDLEQWVGSDDARKTAKRLLYGRGIVGVDVADLLQQTYMRVCARIQKYGPIPIDQGKSIAAYAATALRNIAADMSRGRNRADQTDPQLIENIPDLRGIDAEAFVVDRIADADLLDSLRTCLLTGIEREVWPESAALAFVTLAIDVERNDELGPRPEAGEEGLWRYWTSLWLAGCADVLPDRTEENGDPPAKRKRRQRAIEKMTARLLAAYAEASR